MRAFLLLLLLAGCGDDGPADPTDLGMGSDFGVPLDLSSADGGVLLDSGASDGFVAFDLSSDAFVSDAGLGDGGSVDAPMTAGFGAIAGPCGRLDTELTAADPFLFETRLDFMMDPYDDPADFPLLTMGAQEILTDGTAGGSSGLSEAFAYEVLARCEEASLVKTETEIVYDTAGSLTDMLVMIDGEPIGVSVTRAFVFPPTDPYTVTRATDLLTDKLGDILESSANVSAVDSWTKQILAVVAYGPMHAESIATAWAALDASVRADTIVYVIVTDGDDEPLY